MLAFLFVCFRRAAYLLRGYMYSRIIRSGGGSVGRRLRVEAGLILRQAPHAGYVLGDDIFIGQGSCFDVDPGAELEIGDGVTFAKNVFVSAVAKVSIGHYTLIGENCSIRDANHGIIGGVARICEQPMIGRGVGIGPDVWIGCGVAVLAGSSIGEGCVIGANAVVRGEVAPRSVAVGIPARIVRRR